MTSQVKLTPGATLRLPGGDGTDWREQLLELSASKDTDPALLFWRNYSRRYLTSLCQLPEGQSPPTPPVAR